MPTVVIHPPADRHDQCVKSAEGSNPLPNLLQTPSGLAIIELQGTINLPLAAQDRIQADIEAGGHGRTANQFEIPIGRLIFPDYNADGSPTDPKNWMKRVYLYIGQNQRMTGEVKAIPKPLAVLRRVTRDSNADVEMSGVVQQETVLIEELEIVDIIKYRIYFKSRPEP
ncbi:hypothetical protein KEM54_002805, partial [Ascosphaera aggregata]